MRLLNLELIAYGPFTGTAIDLSQGNEGLHIIYGANEAGKSCALRALTNLFYGIPVRTTDSFVHTNPKLRIGARIRHSDGCTLHFIRRKGRQKTLLNMDGEALDELALARYLGDVSRELFTNLFGIDQTVLVQGGKALISGGGDIGQSLFATGMGIVGMRDVLASLDNETDDLFKPGGKNPSINKLIQEFKAVKKQCKTKSLSSNEYLFHTRTLKDAEDKKQEIERSLYTISAQLNRCERLKKAIPKIVKRQALYDQLKQMGKVILLPRASENFSVQRQKTWETLNNARTAKTRLDKELAVIRDEIAQITLNPQFIQLRQEIKALYLQSGSFYKAQKDLPKLRADRYHLRDEARTILRKMGSSVALPDVEQLRLPDSKIARIRELSHKKDTYDERKRATLKEIRKSELQLATARQDMKNSQGLNWSMRDAGKLAKALMQAQKKGDLQGNSDKLTADLEERQKQADRLLQRIGLWKGSLTQLEQFAAPSEETVLRFDAALTETDAQLRQNRKMITDTKARNLEIENTINTMQGSGSIPTREQLQKARRHRDNGWQIARHILLTGEPDEVSVRAFTASEYEMQNTECGNNSDVVPNSEFQIQHSIAEAYQNTVRRTDDISDRLYSESERAARLAGLLADREQGIQKLSLIEKDFMVAKRSRAQLEKNWQLQWQSLGLTPLPPREMLAWLQNRRQLINQGEDIRRQSAEIERINALIAYHRSYLYNCLAECLPESEQATLTDAQNISLPDENASLDSLIDRCALEVKTIEENRNRCLNLKERINDLEERLTIVQQELNQAEKEQADWRLQWRQAVSCLGLDEYALPEEAEVVLSGVQQLFERMDKARGIHGRIQAIQTDALNFEVQVAQLYSRLTHENNFNSPDETASVLHEQMNQALTDAARREELEKQRRALEKRIIVEKNTIDKMTFRMEELQRLAGNASVEDLPEIENRSELAYKLKDRIERLENELAEYSAGTDIHAFIKDAVRVDADALPAETDALKRKIDELTGKRSLTDQTIGSEKTTLETMGGGTDASELAEKSQALLAELKDAAERYATVRVASAVLLKAVEKYRKTHQGTLLKRAGEIFSHLTLNRFKGLAPDYDEKDNPVLMGVRAATTNREDEKIPTYGMSSGTGDQLYLALRLAAIEQRLITSEPMPLILDDVLVNFDDARALAALDIFSELSRKTQIIFFTHHRHLVELAKEHCDNQTLFCHELN
ncbi:AAA family ATPase [Desulfococcaceae bacterium HSG9]|nr:AAA family ATPase [Desulfococcaceae bacterium HSG9]